MSLFDKYKTSEKEIPERFSLPTSNENEDPDNEEFQTLQDKKTISETKKIDIANEKEQRILIEKKLTKAILMEIGQAIQVSFVHAGRREAPVMSAKLGIPEREKDIQQMIDDMNEKGIEAVISKIEKLGEDEVYY